MIQYVSQYQSKIKEFGHLYQMKLNVNNRWVLLAHHLPWDRLVKIFTKYFSNLGRTAINPRVVIGSIIVKHKLNLSDQETVQTIAENPYIQYFLGFEGFMTDLPYSPSLFVEWRKIIGNDTFNQFTDVLLEVCCDIPPNAPSAQDTKILPTAPKGKLKLDATVADQYISYPNDLGLLNQAREKTEAIVDYLFDLLRAEIKVKPRTYRKVARDIYLAQSKKRQQNKVSLRRAIRYQLNCLDRNIGHINKMLDKFDSMPLSYKMLRTFWIIQTLNKQQRSMYDGKSNRCDDRIVSLSQPHVRPIIRGKRGKKVEFGAKIGLSLSDGFVKAQTISWDAYNESADLIPHVKAYKAFYGYYPELVQVDKIYGTNENRKWCKKNNIRMTVIPKGKPKELSKYEQRKRKKELSERNVIEGKIGQAKQGYELNKVKAKLDKTSNSWIGAILFLTNVINFAKQVGFSF